METEYKSVYPKMTDPGTEQKLEVTKNFFKLWSIEMNGVYSKMEVSSDHNDCYSLNMFITTGNKIELDMKEDYGYSYLLEMNEAINNMNFDNDFFKFSKFEFKMDINKMMEDFKKNNPTKKTFYIYFVCPYWKPDSEGALKLEIETIKKDDPNQKPTPNQNLPSTETDPDYQKYGIFIYFNNDFMRFNYIQHPDLKIS